MSNIEYQTKSNIQIECRISNSIQRSNRMSNIEYQTESNIQVLNVEYQTKSHIQILNVEYGISNWNQHPLN